MSILEMVEQIIMLFIPNPLLEASSSSQVLRRLLIPQVQHLRQSHMTLHTSVPHSPPPPKNKTLLFFLLIVGLAEGLLL